MTKRIKKIAPLQLGKVLAVVYALGTVVFLPFFIIFTVVSSLLQHAGDAPQMVGFLGMGIGFMLFMPIVYGIMGFITGVVIAFIYNLVAGWIGGIELELE